MTNKYQSNPHLQGTNEGNKTTAKESKIICFVAFNQTLDKGFDCSGEEQAGALLLGGRRLQGSHASLTLLRPRRHRHRPTALPGAAEGN